MALGDLNLTGLGLSLRILKTVLSRVRSAPASGVLYTLLIANACVSRAGSHQSAFHLILLPYPYMASTYLSAVHVLNITELSGCGNVIALLLHSFPPASHAQRCHAEVPSCIHHCSSSPSSRQEQQVPLFPATCMAKIAMPRL